MVLGWGCFLVGLGEILTLQVGRLRHLGMEVFLEEVVRWVVVVLDSVVQLHEV